MSRIILQRGHCTCIDRQVLLRAPALPLVQPSDVLHSHQESVYCLVDCRLHIRHTGTDSEKERQKQSKHSGQAL